MLPKFVEPSFVQSLSDPLQQSVVEIDIMGNGQAHSQHFIRLEQMTNIAAGKIAAGWTVTFRIDGALIQLVFFIVNIPSPLPGEEIAMAGISAGHDTVE